MHVLNLVTHAEASFFEQQVTALEERGISSDILPVPGANRAARDGSSHRSVVDYLRFYPQVLRRARRGYDVIHANYGLTAPAAIAQPSRPIVLSLWGSDLLGSYGWLSRWSARHVDAVIVMTEEMEAVLDTVETYVIPHGVDLDRFRPMDRTRARERVGWHPKAVHILFPYPKTRPVKNYPRAKRIVEQLKSDREEEIILHAVSDAAHSEMPVYMNAADALLVTSDREGSPNAVKEAMACNLPVVSTDVGDVATRLEGVTNSCVGHSDADLLMGLATVIESGTRSDGRAHAQPLGLDRMGQRIAAVYESVS